MLVSAMRTLLNYKASVLLERPSLCEDEYRDDVWAHVLRLRVAECEEALGLPAEKIVFAYLVMQAQSGDVVGVLLKRAFMKKRPGHPCMGAQRVDLCLHQWPTLYLMHDGMPITLFYWKLCFCTKTRLPKEFSENGEKFLLLSSPNDKNFNWICSMFLFANSQHLSKHLCPCPAML